jgi:hypothetical protein
MRVFQFLVMFIGLTALGQNSNMTSEDQLKDLIEDSFQNIFSDMELQALETYCTQDFLLLENGEVWDIEKMRNYLKRSRKQNTEVERINSFDFVEINIKGKMAWVAYYNTAEFMLGDDLIREMNWLESATAILTDEGWKLQLLHSTIIKKEKI